METQLICTSQPFCVCAGGPNKWNECCCVKIDNRIMDHKCRFCGAPLVEIDFETGEEVKAA